MDISGACPASLAERLSGVIGVLHDPSFYSAAYVSRPIEGIRPVVLIYKYGRDATTRSSCRLQNVDAIDLETGNVLESCQVKVVKAELGRMHWPGHEIRALSISCIEFKSTFLSLTCSREHQLKFCRMPNICVISRQILRCTWKDGYTGCQELTMWGAARIKGSAAGATCICAAGAANITGSKSRQKHGHIGYPHLLTAWLALIASLQCL